MRRFLVALVIGIAAVGCGGGSGDGDAQASKTHTVGEHGFSLAIPSHWQAVKPDELLTGEDLAAFRAENPEIAPYVDAISSPDSPIEFLAFDPDAHEEFVTNVNVVVLRLGAGSSYEQWADAAAAEAEKLPSRSSALERDEVSLPAGTSLRLRYEQRFASEGATRTVKTTQYGLVGAGRAYVLTFTTLPERERAYADAFGAIVRSFQITA